MNFDEWYKRAGSHFGPDARDAMEAAWNAAKAQSGNYTCDHPVAATCATFANGRKVAVDSDGCLEIGWA